MKTRLPIGLEFCAIICMVAMSAAVKSAADNSHVPSQSSVFCKHCGAKSSDAATLLRNTCPHNHGGKHVLFEGEEADKYICENCGQTYTSLKDLTLNKCPHGYGVAHVPYHGGLRAEYTCRWCGQNYKNLKDMTRNSCSRHPNGKGSHRPL